MEGRGKIMKKEVHKFYKGICQICFEKVAIKDICLDHITPNSKYLVLVHKTCNKLMPK